MTQAMVKTVATELGALVQRREALNEAVRDAKRNLSYFRNWHAPDPEQIERGTAYIRERIKEAEVKRDSAQQDLNGLLELRTYANSDTLRTLLEKLIGNLQSDVTYHASTVESLTKEIEQRYQIEDPRIQYSNALAVAESELETVREQIKQARKEAK